MTELSTAYIMRREIERLTAENARLRNGLERARDKMRLAFGAIETRQAEEKDAHGMLVRGWNEARAALTPTEETL